MDPIMKKIRSWVSKENLIYDDNDTEGKLQPSRKKTVAATPTEKMLEKENRELQQENDLLRHKLDMIQKNQGRSFYGETSTDNYEVSILLCNLILFIFQTFLHVKV